MAFQRHTLWTRMFSGAGVERAAEAQNVDQAPTSSAIRPLALEQRFMFDGAGAVDALHIATDGVSTADTGADTASALHHALMAQTAPAAATQRQEVVFVDRQVTNLDALLKGLPSAAEVVMLDAQKDGLQQMADYLKGREGLDAIHLLSHGADGTVQMGNVWLSSGNLAEHSTALQSIGAALKADGDLMLYGCSLGESSKGQAFLDALALITGADVAGSIDNTGGQALGGNWILELHSGKVETTALFQAAQEPDWNHLLANVSFPGGGFSYSEGQDVDVYTSTFDALGQASRNLFLLNAAGTYTFTGNVNSGSNDGTDVIPIQIPQGYAIASVTFQAEGDLIAGNFLIESASGTSATLFSKKLSNNAQSVNSSTSIGAGLYSVYIGNDTNVFGYTLNLSVVAIMEPPVIGNLNGDAVSYVEDSAYVLLDSGSNATVSDADSVNFSGGKMTVQVTANRVDGQDVLFIRNQGNGANQISISGNSITYNGLQVGTYTGGSNGNPLVVTFTSNANPTTVAALVQNLAYRNSNTVDPATTQRDVSISMDDGAGGNSTVSVVTLDVLSVNDTPLATVVATNPTYTENTSAVQLFSGATINTIESGQKVSQMVFTVSTVYNGAAEKLVIDGSDVMLINGASVVTNDNSTVVTVSVTSGTAIVTLSSAGLNVATAQTILNTMAYRNDSESPNTANRVVTLNSVSDNGGSDNSGNPTASVGIFSTVTVVGVNDAPVLAGAPYSLPSINEDTTSAGTRISFLLTNYTMVDPDVGAQRGIAVITKSGNGIWQYSTDNANWTDFGAVSSTSALLLASSTYIRYVPDGANGETASLTFRAWDQTTGSASVNGIRGTADTSSNGGTTAFSIATAVANQPVTSVNDAPVMTGVLPTLTGITDSSTNNAGNLVSSLTGGITDVDTGAVKGIAITGLTGTYGKWQYSTDAGSTWTDVGAVSNATALILNASNKVRYVPDGVHGETATLTYKAWDQTGGSAGLEGSKRDTSISGGTSAYSLDTDTASVVVTAVNDAPVVTVSGGSASWTEGNNVASTPVVVDLGLTLSDADGPNPLSASARMLTYYSSQDTLSFVNDGLTMGNIIGTWTVGTGTLTLTSAGNQATVAQFEAALRAITYNNSSNSPNTTTRTVQFIVTDGSSAQSTAVTRDITITAVNNSPTISAVASLPISEDTQTALGQITFNDVDTTLGTVTFSVGSGTLSAIGAGGVTVGGTATALTLSGTLANINNFIFANRLLYTPAANASGDVTLTININTSSVSDATTTVTLQVAAVNDAPVITAPASITVTEDVSSVISGFSFTDVDAGANTVTATFSVPSGTLSANRGFGVSVSGSDTGELVLSGSLADINLFVAANGVTFKTAQDSTTNVVLSVTLNDKGFSGSGGEKTDTKTVTLNVSAVNDAPVNNVPGAQTASQNIALGFNTANGNAISITDVDAGNGLMTVTLTATNGTLSLGSLSGITLLLGTGTNDASMIFEGNRANLNAALQTLNFKSGSSFLGAASLTIETNDNGNSGSGGAKTDVDTIWINVIPVNPKVVSVAAQGLDRTVKAGDEVLINMTWDQVVNVDTNGGAPGLLLETGLVDRLAVYVSGSGSNTLVFRYTVQAGDRSADLDFQSAAALQLNGAVVANASNDLAVLTLPTVGGADSLGGRSNIVVDGVVPVVANVSAPVDGTYIVGQHLDFTVNFSENVVVDTSTGVPRIAVTLDTGGTVYADYMSGSGGSALVFRLTVAHGQLDSNGVALGSSIDTNGGAITDLAGNATVTALQNVASMADVKVDSIAPYVLRVEVPSSASYKAGDVLRFTVHTNEIVQIGSLPPRLVLDIGGMTRYATYVSGDGSAALLFSYTVAAGENDSNGIAVTTLDWQAEVLTDAAGNTSAPLLSGVASTAAVLVDNVAPSAVGIVRAASTPDSGESVSFTVTFNEPVSGVDISDFVLSLGGSASGAIAAITPVTGSIYTVLVNNLHGTGTVAVDLRSGGTGIVDAAGNALQGGLQGERYSIDRAAPNVTHVQVPLSGTYGTGQHLDFIVHLDKTVQVGEVGQGPRLAITLDTGGTVYAQYLSGSGSHALVFRWTVAPGKLDASGISLAGGIELNGATLRDAAGNDVPTALRGVPSTAAVLIDSIAAQASLSLDKSSLTAQDTAQLTVRFDKPVVGLDLADFTVTHGQLTGLASTDGGRTWSATLTPAQGVSQGNLQVVLHNAGYRDQWGNVGEGVAVSGSYAIDTLPAPVPVPGASQPWGGQPAAAGPAGIFSLSPTPVPAALLGASRFLGHVPDPFSRFLEQTQHGFFTGTASETEPLYSGFLGHARQMGWWAQEGLVPAGTFTQHPSLDGLPLLQAVDRLQPAPNGEIQWQVPGSMFGHNDPQAQLQLAMGQVDGRALPSWLRFDPRTGQLQGRMPEGFQGVLQLRLTARDAQGRSVSTTIELRAPSDRSSVPDRGARAGVSEQLAQRDRGHHGLAQALQTRQVSHG